MARGGFLTFALVAGLVVIVLYAFGGGSITDLLGGSSSSPTAPVDSQGNPIGTQAYLTTNLPILDSVDTWVAWDALNFDHGGYADLGVDPYNLTVDVAGDYLISAQMRWEAYEPLSRTTTIMLNGAFNAEAVCTAPATVFFCTKSITLTLAAGDDVAVRVGQDSGITLDLISGSSSSRFQVIPQ